MDKSTILMELSEQYYTVYIFLQYHLDNSMLCYSWFMIHIFFDDDTSLLLIQMKDFLNVDGSWRWLLIFGGHAAAGRCWAGDLW